MQAFLESHSIGEFISGNTTQILLMAILFAVVDIGITLKKK